MFTFFLSYLPYSAEAATSISETKAETTKWKEKINVPADKEWVINFNSNLNPSSVDFNTIYVKDSYGILVDTVVEMDGDNRVRVKPPLKGYLPGEVYTLCISDGLKSKVGKSLSKSVELVFAVGESSGNIPVQGIDLGPNTTSIEVGEVQELNAIVAPSNATDQEITWKSDNPAVAQVQNGMIVGVAKGKATITVTTKDGSHSDFIDVEVVEKKVTYQVYNGQEFVKDFTEQADAIKYAGSLENGKVVEKDTKRVIWEKEINSITQLELTERATLYGEPSFLSTTYGSLSPQKVTVLEALDNGWYKIQTYLGDRWIAPNGMKVPVEKETVLYEEATLTSKTSGKINPQVVTAIGASSGGWLKISSEAGEKWINLTETPDPPVENVQKLVLKEQTVLYAEPTKSSKTYGSLAPQTVTVLEVGQNGWYKIKTYLGDKWIFVQDTQPDPEPQQLETLQLKERATLYKDANFLSTTYGSITPQTVKIVEKKEDGWYKIQTYLGEKWIAPNGMKVKLAKAAKLYEEPSLTSKTFGQVSPQEVTAIEEKAGNWYKIQTYLGEKWINLSTDQDPPKDDGIKLVLKEQTVLYGQADFQSNTYGALLPQTVTVIEDKKDGWYKIKTWTGDKWIAPNGIKLKVQIATTLYDEASLTSKTYGQVSPQEVTVIGAKSGGWYKIKSWVGDKWIAPNGVDFKVTENMALYDEPSIDSKLSAQLSPQTVKVTEIVGSEWYKVKTWLGEKWIFLGKNSPSSDNSFLAALKFAAKWEGGYANHPNDYGGLTNRGITQSTYDSYRKSIGQSTQSVKYITEEEYDSISYNWFFVPIHGSEMDDALAIVMFDTSFNFGPGGAIQFLQQTLGVTADGGWGSITDKAFKNKSISQHKELALKIVQIRMDYRYQRVNRDSSQRVFLQGWLNRDNDLKAYIQNM